jgi:N-acyl homoserine lactone hydrolase
VRVRDQIRLFNSTDFKVAASLMNAASPTGRSVVIPTVFALLFHRDAVVLVDAGYRCSLPEPDVVPVTDVPSALEAEGLTAAQITHVVLTHLHVDHVGWLDLFEDAELVCQRKELAYARAPDLPVMVPEYPPWTELSERRWLAIDGDHDLLGDGAIRLLATPGHTPGHQSVLAALGARPTLLAGDAVWTAECLDPKVMPGLLWDAAAYIESRCRLRAEAERTGARWVHSHEPSTFACGRSDG